jgi:hypothetical protein
MNVLTPVVLGATVAVLTMQLAAQAQPNSNRGQEKFAAVKVLAFDTAGRFLGSPNIKLFESETGENLAGKFRGGIAEDIPPGVYRIEAGLPAYYPARKFVRVYQPEVTVIVGLESGFREASTVPLVLHGRITNEVPAVGKHPFVKALGVFADVSAEAIIGPDGTFDLPGLGWGTYLLLVVDEDGVLASRTVTIPYTGSPLQIELKSDHAGARQ